MNIVNLLKNWDFEDLTDWPTTTNTYPTNNLALYYIDPNYAFTRNTFFLLKKTEAGRRGCVQDIDFDRDIEGEEFDIGGWIRVTVCDAGNYAKLFIQWLDSGGSQVGSDVSIANITSTQYFTLASSTETAPSGAQQIRYKFECGPSTNTTNVTALLDTTFVCPTVNYGLKVYDTAGNSNTVVADMISLISSGTSSMLNTFQDDDTYGNDIDLPGTEYINTEDIGVIAQTRNFDFKTEIDIVSYDSGNKFWGTFYADDAITYYEKATDGVMSSWSASADVSDPLINISLVAGWDRYATSVQKVRLFSGILYNFLKTVGAGTVTNTLYAKNYAITTSGSIGYMMSTTQGDTENYYEYKSLQYFWYCLWGPHSKFDIYIVHADGSQTTLDTDVAAIDVGQAYATSKDKESSYNATWVCPGYGAWATTDALRFVLKINGTFASPQLSTYNWNFSISYVTPQLNWSTLDATTWTLYRYIWWQGIGNAGDYGLVRAYFGATKEVKATNIDTTSTSSSQQTVYTIGDSGVSDVDYMISLKNYNGD